VPPRKEGAFAATRNPYTIFGRNKSENAAYTGFGRQMDGRSYRGKDTTSPGTK